MSDDVKYSGLGVVVKQRPDQGVYEFGVMLDGAFVSFGARKTGDVDPEIDAAKAAGESGSTGSTDTVTPTQ